MGDKREYEINPMGHVWETEDGSIDIFAYSVGSIHNGPRCVNCGYGFCHHCQPKPDHECARPRKRPTDSTETNAASGLLVAHKDAKFDVTSPTAARAF